MIDVSQADIIDQNLPQKISHKYKIQLPLVLHAFRRSLYCHVIDFCDVNRFWERKREEVKKISSKEMVQSIDVT